MALDPDGGAALPTKKKKRKLQVAPVMGEQATGGAKVPAARRIPDEGTQVGREPYLGSTNPAFQRMGFSGDIFTLNKRVEAANYAFETQFGYAPSPALLLDLVRAPVQTEEFEDLFGIPSSFQRARAAFSLQDDLASAQEIPKEEGGPYAGVIRVEEYEGQREEDIAEGQPDLAYAATLPLGMEFRDEVGAFEKYAFGVPILAVAQIVEGLAGVPVGAYFTAKAVGSDVSDLRGGDYSFDASQEIARQMVHSVAEDFRHPLENPGNLTLDFLGAGSAGAGLVARGSAVGKAARASGAVKRGAEIPGLSYAENLRFQTLNRAAAGQTGRAVISALLRRPLPGTYVIGPDGAQERVNLSENSLRRGVQRLYYANLNRNIKERLEARPETLATPQTTGKRIKAELDKTRKSVLSYEKTLGRHANVRMKVERRTYMTPVHEFERTRRASNHLADVLKRLPLVRSRKKFTGGLDDYGLSVGEQMAILFDSTKGPDPVGHWQNWHTKMIEWGIGDPEAHRAKLAAVELGAEAFRNPSKRLTRAIESSRRLSEEQELIKIKYLGLDEGVAVNRVNSERRILEISQASTSKTDFFRKVNDHLAGPPITARLDDAWYFPQPMRKDKDIQTRDFAPGSRSSGRFGHPVPQVSRVNPELNHRFEGKAIMSGDTIVDPRNLVDKYTRVGKSVFAIDDHKRLVALSVEVPNAALKSQRGFLRPVRTIEGVPDELRKKLGVFYEDRVVTAEEVSQLSKGKALEDLHAWMYPDFEFGPDGTPRLTTGESIEGVRWVDERYAVDLHRYPGEPSLDAKIFQAVINEPLRALTLYARAGYAMNAVSNAGMLAVHAKHAAPAALYKSLTARKRYGDKGLAWMDNQIDEGKSRSFTPDDIALAKVSRSMANIWSVIVDRWMRRAALIYEMERRGYNTKEKVEELADFKNEKAVKDRVEIVERSNKAMVQFDNLTWFEKSRLRHFIFVYPWVSRSTVWTLRTILDRPLTTWTMNELSQIGEEAVEETWEDVTGWAKQYMPEWLEEGGYFPTGGFDKQGNPLIVNYNSANTFSTLADLMKTGEGAFTDDPFYSFEDLLGPGAELGLRIVTGRNAYGQKYEHGALGGIAEVVSQVPPLRGFSRPKEEGPKLDPKTGKPLPVRSSYQTLTSAGQARSPADRPVLLPAMDTWYAPMVSAGVFPRGIDIEAAAERYWEDQPQEDKENQRAKIQEQMLREKTKWEIFTMRHAEDITSKILGKAVPKQVKDIIRLQGRFQNAYLDDAVEGKKGRMPTEGEQRFIQIQVLKDTGRISDDIARGLTKDLAKALNRGAVEDFSNPFADQYLHRQALREWHTERDAVLDKANNLVAQTDYLKKTGLFKGETPKAKNIYAKQALPGITTTIEGLETIRKQDLKGVENYVESSPAYQVGRKYLEYEQVLRAHEAAERSGLEGVRGAEHRRWLDEQDTDIKIAGKSFPSPVRLKWAADILVNSLEDPDYEVKKLSALSVQGWATLTEFEKEVVGRPAAKGVTTGWMVYEAITGGLRGNVTEDDVEGITITVSGKKEPLALSVPTPWPEGRRDIPQNYKVAIAKAIDKQISPGFFKDFLHADKPKYQRVQVLPFFTKSPDREDWMFVFGAVEPSYREIVRLREAEEDGITAVQDRWKDYASQELYPSLLKDGSPELKKQLEFLGGVDFLRTLISDA